MAVREIELTMTLSVEAPMTDTVGMAREGSATVRPSATRRTVVAALAAGIVSVAAQGPLLLHRPVLFVANVLVSMGLAAGAAVLSVERSQRGTVLLMSCAAVLWAAAWMNEWNVGVLPFLAALVGPAPGVLAIWGLFRYPSGPRIRHETAAFAAVFTAKQFVAVMLVLVARPAWTGAPAAVPWLSIWPSETAYTVLGLVDAGSSALLSLTVSAAFILRAARMRGPDRRLVLPVAVSVTLGGLGDFASSTASALGAHGAALSAWYLVEDVLVVPLPVAFLTSTLIRRFSADRAAHAMTALRAGALPREVERAVRSQLADPRAVVLYRVGDTPLWVDSTGAAADPEQHRRSGADMRVLTDPATSTALAVIAIDPAVARYSALVDTALSTVRLTLDNSRLLLAMEAEVLNTQASEERLRVLAHHERERIRDQTMGGPYGHVTEAARLVNQLTTSGDPSIETLAVRAAERLAAAAASLDELSRGVDPLELRERGLVGALTVEQFGHDGVRLHIDSHSLAVELERLVYYLVVEAVTNAVKHARARTIDVHVFTGVDAVTVEVVDDGIGGALRNGVAPSRLDHAVASANGSLRVTSDVGAGTRIVARFPR